jgi:hypothetical protein
MQLLHAESGMFDSTSGQERQDITQVGPRLDVVQLAACNEAGGDGVPLGTADNTIVGRDLTHRQDFS